MFEDMCGMILACVVGIVIGAIAVVNLASSRDEFRVKNGYMSTDSGFYKLVEVKP